MGNIIIAKTLKDANEIAVIVNRRSRIVTLDGDVVHPGGSISGGAKQKSKSTLFSREKELEEITSQVVDDEGKAKEDRKSTRLNSSHVAISYAVFCLKKKKKKNKVTNTSKK